MWSWSGFAMQDDFWFDWWKMYGLNSRAPLDHTHMLDLTFSQPQIRNTVEQWLPTVNGSQPGCRGTLGCHLQCPGVPRANTFFYHIIKNAFSSCHQTSKQIAVGAVNYYSFL